MDQNLRRILLLDNPWMGDGKLRPWLRQRIPKPFISRHLRLPELKHKAILVVGPRQVGKSTLIWKTLADRAQPVLYLNCEELSIREWLRSPGRFLSDLETLEIELSALFFEEIQALEEAGLFLKGLVDRRLAYQIYATGSSSFDLQAQTRESLAGRAQRHLLLPFSVEEIASSLPGQSWAQTEELEQQIAQMLIYGSYPSVYLAARPWLELADLVEAFIVRDASDRFQIRHPTAFRKILQLAASQIGNLVNTSEWASLSGVSHGTVSDYCSLLEESHVIRLLRPFVGGKRAEITSARKAYFLDNGIRNQLFGGFGPIEERADRGALFENFVFSEISKHVNPLLDSLRYWRSKSGAEVDFVIEHQGRLMACEVKAGRVRSKLSRSARSFIAAYRPELFLIVSQQTADALDVDGTRVVFVTPKELSERLTAWLAPGKLS